MNKHEPDLFNQHLHMNEMSVEEYREMLKPKPYHPVRVISTQNLGDIPIDISEQIVYAKPSKELLEDLIKEPEEVTGEMHFSWWIDDLIKAGYIRKVVAQPPPFILSEQEHYYIRKPMIKVEDKMLPKQLLDSHIYTPDYTIYWTESAHGLFFCPFTPTEMLYPLAPLVGHYDSTEEWYSVIECKPEFDQNNMTRLFRVSQKWVFSLYRILINEVHTPSFFQKTFTPLRYFYTDKSGGKRKIKYKAILLQEYVQSRGF